MKSLADAVRAAERLYLDEKYIRRFREFDIYIEISKVRAIESSGAVDDSCLVLYYQKELFAAQIPEFSSLLEKGYCGINVYFKRAGQVKK